MIKLPTREDFERLVKINTERNEWNREYYAHLPARQQWKAWQTAIAEVQRLNATAQPVSDGWVKCSERIPEHGTSVIVWDGEVLTGESTGGVTNYGLGIFWVKDYKEGFSVKAYVTHWMPLPSAPGGQDD